MSAAGVFIGLIAFLVVAVNLSIHKVEQGHVGVYFRVSSPTIMLAEFVHYPIKSWASIFSESEVFDVSKIIFMILIIIHPSTVSRSEYRHSRSCYSSFVPDHPSILQFKWKNVAIPKYAELEVFFFLWL